MTLILVNHVCWGRFSKPPVLNLTTGAAGDLCFLLQQASKQARGTGVRRGRLSSARRGLSISQYNLGVGT